MKKICISVICVLLSALTLIGCTPASQIVKDTTNADTAIFQNPGEDYLTDPKDYVIKSKNYAFFSGEYLYFFINILTSFGKEELEKYGYNSELPLKEQNVNGLEMTWFEFIDTMTMDRIKRILVACEYARAEKTSYLTEAKSYIDTVKNDIKYASDNDPEGYIEEMYGKGVSYQSYLNALQMEYVYELYHKELYEANMEQITDSEVAERAGDPDGKDQTPVRNVIYAIADSRGQAEDIVLDLGGDVTESSVTELVESYSLYPVYDCLTRSSEVSKEIIDWTFAAERTVGESAVLKLEKNDHYEYAVAVYFGEGEETYRFEARLMIAGEKTDKLISDAVAAYDSFKTDPKILDGINI